MPSWRARRSAAGRGRSPSVDRWVATCSQPRNQPSARFVLPRASICARRSMALRRASADAGVDSTTTSITSSYTTMLKRSRSSRRASASSTACLASVELGARHRARAVEHEGEVDGRALATRVAGGAVSSTSTNRWLRSIGRMRRRSARAVRTGHDGSSSSRSRAISTRRSTRLAVDRGSGRRMWSSTSGARLDALPLGAFESGGGVGAGSGWWRYRRRRRASVAST